MRGTAWMVRGAVFGVFMASGTAARCQERGTAQAALATAMRARHVTLATGVEAAAAHGKPVSAKYEYEDGKLQLSVYTEKGGQFSEVIVDYQTGRVAKTGRITAGDDLKAAQAQGAATAKAKSSLVTALSRALPANTGFGAVSVTATLKGGQAVAEITLVKGTEFKTVTEPLS